MMAEEVENCVVEEKAKPFNEELEDGLDPNFRTTSVKKSEVTIN